MTVLTTTEGRPQLQCDGCGRAQDDRGPSLGIREFVANDPNVGGAVQHHYCVGCAANRGYVDVPVLTMADWAASPPPAVGPNETNEEHLAAMRGEVEESSGRGRPVPKDDDERRRLEQVGFRYRDDEN